MKISKYLLLSMVFIGLSTSCEKAYILPEPITPPDPNAPPLSFATDIQPIFSACTGCHNPSQAPNLTSGNSYAALVPAFVTPGNPSTSILYTTLAGPGGKMYDLGETISSAELANISTWITEGAQNN